jgi:hypothetical protein
VLARQVLYLLSHAPFCFWFILQTGSDLGLWSLACATTPGLRELEAFLFFFHGTGVWTQGLMLARLALYHWSHSASPGSFSWLSLTLHLNLRQLW